MNLEEFFQNSEKFSHHALLLLNKKWRQELFSYENFLKVADLFCGITLDAKPLLNEDGEWTFSHPDILLIDRHRESLRKEEVAEIVDFVSFLPRQARRRLVWLERAHRMSLTVANSLLKAIEEPRIPVLFFLTAGSHQEVISTICSRCLRIPLVIPQEEIYSSLSSIEEEDLSFLRMVFSKAHPDVVYVFEMNIQGEVFLDPDLFYKIVEQSQILAKKYQASLLQDVFVELIGESWKKNPALASVLRCALQDIKQWRDLKDFNLTGALWISRILIQMVCSSSHKGMRV